MLAFHSLSSNFIPNLLCPEGRDNGQMGGRDRMGRMGDMGGPDKTDSDDWRARPTADADDGPPKREESAFGESLPLGSKWTQHAHIPF